MAVDIPGNSLARAHASPASPRHEYLSPEFAAAERGSPLTPGPYEARRDHRGFVLDPTIPDVTSSVYMSDEFRMFSFKVRTPINFVQRIFVDAVIPMFTIVQQPPVNSDQVWSLFILTYPQVVLVLTYPQVVLVRVPMNELLSLEEQTELCPCFTRMNHFSCQSL